MIAKDPRPRGMTNLLTLYLLLSHYPLSSARMVMIDAAARSKAGIPDCNLQTARTNLNNFNCATQSIASPSRISRATRRCDGTQGRPSIDPDGCY